MKKYQYKDEINFVEEQSKQDRKRDPAIDYSYENKLSIFKKYSKSRKEKKNLIKVYKEKKSNNDKINDNFNNYDDNICEYNKNIDTDNNLNSENLEKVKTWLSKNMEIDTDKIFDSIKIDSLKKEYKNIQNSIDGIKGNSKNNKKKSSKLNGYRVCKNCGTQLENYAEKCPRCGRKIEDKKKSSVASKIIKVILILLGIHLILNLGSLFFLVGNIFNDSNSDVQNTEYEEPYIDYDEYTKPIALKYLVPKEKVKKIEKEKIVVGKDIEAGEYIFIRNTGNSMASIEIDRKEEDKQIFETVNRNYYVNVYDGDKVKLENGVLYNSDQVELDLKNENNKKSGMYRLGKDVGEYFTIEGNSRTYYSIFDENNNIVKNGFLKEEYLNIDEETISSEYTKGKDAKYIYINGGILITE